MDPQGDLMKNRLLSARQSQFLLDNVGNNIKEVDYSPDGRNPLNEELNSLALNTIEKQGLQLNISINKPNQHQLTQDQLSTILKKC